MYVDCMLYVVLTGISGGDCPLRSLVSTACGIRLGEGSDRGTQSPQKSPAASRFKSPQPVSPSPCVAFFPDVFDQLSVFCFVVFCHFVLFFLCLAVLSTHFQVDLPYFPDLTRHLAASSASRPAI
jgi:hypothetical protein